MQDLTVIGIENGALLVASETGERYRVAIDEVLQSRLRQSTIQADSGTKVSPREIQAQIRAGMSAEDVARATGASLEYVERFEGPVLAERLHIVSSALRVPVKLASSSDPLRGDPLSDDQSSTFGDVIEERLDGLSATDLRWASWKEETGWVVKLTFTASQIDHDARWQFDPKRQALTPLNSGAITLSQQGEIVEGLIPRLRAVDADARRSDAFSARTETPGLALDELDDAFPIGTSGETQPVGSDPTAPPVLIEPTPFSRLPFARTGEESSPAAAAAAVTRQPPSPAAQNETADLLEALRRRRGEREAAPFRLDGDDDFDALASTGHPSTRGDSGAVASGSRGDTRPVAHLTRGSSGTGGFAQTSSPSQSSPSHSQTTAETTDDDQSGRPSSVTTLDGLEEATGQQRQTGPQPRSKRRTAMPSWDEIVFGARSDDDLS